MKAKVLTLFILLLLGSSMNVSGMEIYNADVAEKENVLLKKGDGSLWNDKDNPRSQDVLFVTCQYEDETVYLNFLQDLGLVELTVTNLNTGEVWSTEQLSNNGSLSLETSTDSGNYKVEIKTELDGNYIGYFTR